MKILSHLKSNEKTEKKSSGKAITPVSIDDLSKSLVDAIDHQLEQSNGVIWKQSNSFAPSNSNQCARYAVYRLRGFEQQVDFSGKLRRIFDLGDRVEDQLKKLFDGLGIVIDEQKEINITEPVPIRGFIDFIVDWNGPKIVECKSINDAGFLWRKTYNKAKDEHYRQIQFYLHAEQLDQGFVVYINKNDSEMLPILVEQDEIFIEKTLAKYAKIYKTFLNGDLPLRPYKQSSKNCSYCDARQWCWEDNEVGVKL